ncbi:MAG: glycosyltransferase family 2 protein [Lachnospiraceae bacterium]
MITILMAVYNGEMYLKEQLESIRRQTYSKWRLIARDDGSKDNSVKILEEFASSVQNEVTVYVNQPACGCAKNNFARLLNDAAGSEYIMFSDQDDVWKEDKLKTSMDKMHKLEEEYGSKTPLLVHSDLEVVNENMEVIAESMFDYSDIRREATLGQLLLQNNVTGCTMLFNSVICDAVIPYIADGSVIMHDYFIALYAKVFGKTAFIDTPLVSYRQHDSNSVGAKASKNLAYLFKRFMEGKKAYKEAVWASTDQAWYFMDVYTSPLIRQSLFMECIYLIKYSNICNMSIFKRLGFFISSRAWKKGFIRKIMQVLWG